ncbi:MAG: BNR-4 repeat-containing protein [Armatimonadota bacterium]
MHITTITTDGSDRATAYGMTNKIVRLGGKVYLTWQQFDYRAVVAQFDPATGVCGAPTALALGSDNHCGAALAATPSGELHAMAGAHTAAFIHRSTATPDDPDSWSLPLAVGACATYPSLVCDPAGRLHLAYRYKHLTEGDPGGVIVQHYGGDRRWSWSQLVTMAVTPGYHFPTNALAVALDGTLHLLVGFYKNFPQKAAPARVVAIGHFTTDDGGATWRHTDGRPMEWVPCNAEDITPVRFNAAGGLGFGHPVILPDGQPCCIIGHASGLIELARRRGDGTWASHPLSAAIEAMRPGWLVNESGQLALNARGELVTVTGLVRERGWSRPEQELCVLWLDPADGAVLRHAFIPKTQPDAPDWLASIEKAATPADDGLYLLYTSGLSGTGLTSQARCTVRLCWLK